MTPKGSKIDKVIQKKTEEVKSFLTNIKNTILHNKNFSMSCKGYKKLETSSKISELSKIRDFVEQECTFLSFDKDWVKELLTVVIEVISNIMRHAYEGKFDGPIVTELTMYDDRVKLTFSDWGKDFKPDKISPPIFDGTREGGYGWFIINHYSDKVHYTRNGDGKNTLVLIKKFKTEK